jgi:hypothetical protein
LKATDAASTFDECSAIVVTKVGKIFPAADFCHDRRGFPPQAGHNFARDERVSSQAHIRRDWAGVRRSNFVAFTPGELSLVKLLGHAGWDALRAGFKTQSQVV